MTPRQLLISSAAAELRTGNASTAHQALEIVSGSCAGLAANTYGAAMRAYYRNTSNTALERLIKAVERNAK